MIKLLASQGVDSFVNLDDIMIRHWYLFVWPSFSYFISHVLSPVGMGDVRRFIDAIDIF